MHRSSYFAFVILSLSILTVASPVTPVIVVARAGKAPAISSAKPKSTPAKKHPAQARIAAGPAIVAEDDDTKAEVSYQKGQKIGKGDKKGGSSVSKSASATGPNATKIVKQKQKSKRAAGNCMPLSVDDVKKLAGWKTLEAKAKEDFGKGKYKLVTNPEQYPDRPALVCVQEQKSPITIKGKADCTNSQQATKGQLVGTEGEVKLTQEDGVATESEITVTTESAFGTGVTAGVEFGIPGLGKGTVSTTFTAEIRNSLANSQRSSSSTVKGHELTMKAPNGKKCFLDYNSITCSGRGEGTVDYIATGYVWFNYHSKTKGHYKWAMKIEDALPNIADRSSQLKYSARIKSDTKTDWNGKCS